MESCRVATKERIWYSGQSYSCVKTLKGGHNNFIALFRTIAYHGLLVQRASVRCPAQSSASSSFLSSSSTSDVLRSSPYHLPADKVYCPLYFLGTVRNCTTSTSAQFAPLAALLSTNTQKSSHRWFCNTTDFPHNSIEARRPVRLGTRFQSLSSLCNTNNAGRTTLLVEVC